MTDTMRAWRTQYYAEPLEALKLDEVPIPQPGDNEVLVKVQGIPLNLNDLERVKGGNMMVEPELPYSPGMEVMGVVHQCGAGAESWAGKRVVAITAGAHGGFAEYAVCPIVSAFEMPDSVALPDAAALYFPFHLAWLGLYDRADLQENETVLIHAAAGGAGSAAIQLAKLRGARVIATAGTNEKLALCASLGADATINYETDDFAAKVMELTNKQGVDVVFDNVGEAVMEKSMNCLRYNGRYVMNGFASDKSVADEKFLVPRRIALGNFRLCGVLLAYADDASGAFIKEAMGWNFPHRNLGESITKQLVELVNEGKLKAVVGRTESFEHLPQCLQDMADRKTVGRTIVIV
ncbi:MAG: zinc-binding alcohol dehydrogenase family protein [Pseudomonadales bacterium]